MREVLSSEEEKEIFVDGTLSVLILADLAVFGKIRQIKYPPKFQKLTIRQIKYTPNLTNSF